MKHFICIASSYSRSLLTPKHVLSNRRPESVHVFISHRRSNFSNKRVFASKNEGDRVDWDGAWKRFQKPKQTSSSSPRSRGVRSPLDAIRKEEDRVLGAWSSTRFTQLGLASVLLLLFMILVVAGAPPTGRCTLPWC